jgi:NitT/TauT family transport system ATP-binding protein/nitrate/nitrite transport system substrate-binding protein
MALTLGGNTVTFTTSLADAIAAPSAFEAVRHFKAHLAACATRPVLAVVHPFSSHNLLLRYWLAAGGVDPDRDVVLDVVPPARVVEALATGRIVGFCAGAPWGEVAVRAGLGRTVVPSSAIWRDHPEKVFAVTRAWAEADAGRLQALLRALIRAARFCSEPGNAAAAAHLISARRWLDLDPEVVAASLPIFSTYPWPAHAGWFLHQMARWGYVDPATALPEIYRPDLYASAAADVGVALPTAIPLTEFCDGAVFDPTALAPLAATMECA